MNRRLSSTLRVLKETSNEAALDVLLWALDSTDLELQDAVVVALLERRSPAGHRELVRRWPSLPERWKSLISERASRLEAALRSAILSTDTELHRNACEAAVFLRGYDLVPTLISAGEDKGNSQAEFTCLATLQLCEQLYAELAAPRDYRNRRDPVLVRQYIYAALEQAMVRFEQHGRAELLESFLLLAHPDDAVLRRCLQRPSERVYNAMISALIQSTRPPVQRLVLRFLDDAAAPPGLHLVLSRRRDTEFLRLLFQKCQGELSTAVKCNLRRVDALPWLRDNLDWLAAFSGDEQRGSVQVALASGMNRLRVFELLKWLMKNGEPAGRRSACAALVEFKGHDANHLVVAALDDHNPEVQALAVSQVRDRGIPGIVPRLIELVDSPQEAVRTAARKSLVEFSFARFLNAFETMEPQVRASTGVLVKRIDPTTTDQLIHELESVSRVRRLRAIEVAVVLDLVPQVEQQILELARDDDHFVRTEAARALAFLNSEPSRDALRHMLRDRSVSVQEQAVQSLTTRIGKAEIVSLDESLSLWPLNADGNTFGNSSMEPQP